MTLQNRFFRIALLFTITILFGTFGYRIIEGWSMVNCLYMAVITLTTVGFSEVSPLSPAGRAFTVVLILFGVGSITYSFGALANYVIAGELQGFLGVRRMKRRIDSLKDHVLICGYGRMGREICVELEREEKPFVVIDANEESFRQAVEDGYLAYLGDPGLDDTLKACGIEQAKGVSVVSDDDAKNIMVIISARGLNPDLQIVARVSADDAPDKFIRAGADSVFLPYKTGGRRLAQMLVRPEVVGFLEDILHDESSLGVLIEDIVVEKGCELEGLSLKDARIRDRTGVYVVGIKRPGEGTVPDLKPTTELKAGDRLIVLGKKEQLSELEMLLMKV